MYERMLFGNKAFKELFRALEAGETPVLFHCSGAVRRTASTRRRQRWTARPRRWKRRKKS